MIPQISETTRRLGLDILNIYRQKVCMTWLDLGRCFSSVARPEGCGDFLELPQPL
jgi:hypothetical protein